MRFDYINAFVQATAEVLNEMDEDTALNIAGRMNGEEFAKTEPMVLDSIGELMNIIVGRSITILNDKGYKFYLTPPVISAGKDVNFSFASMETLVVKVTTGLGVITVNVALAPEI